MFQAFVKRPIMATAINLVLLTIGLVAFQQLELRNTPSLQKNEFGIQTLYPGANNLSVERKVTKPIEDALSGIEGVRKIISESSDGVSEITVKFRSNVNHKTASSELRDRVFNTLSNMPATTEKPLVYEKQENQKALLRIVFEDKSQSIAALSDYIKRVIEDRLKLVEGVSKVDYWGNMNYIVAVDLDPLLLMENKVTVSEVLKALEQEKAFASGGEIEREYGNEKLVLNLAANNIDDFAAVTVKTFASHSVRVGDVGTVKIIEKPGFMRANVNGKYSVGLQVYAKPNANPFQVAKGVHNFFNKVQKNMPAGTKAYIAYDATLPFKNSINDLKKTLIEAIVLVGVIVTCSLRSVRAALLPMITVPLCLIATFALMWVFGFSVNPITLLALVLAVGLVVDDAIVVVENIHHHMERGLSSLQAAMKSMKEISFAVVVMSITLAAVFMPIAFQSDDSIIMFREFAWTLAGSVIISGFVALTLTPALCGRFLKNNEKFHTPSEFMQGINRGYQYYLNKALANPKRIGLITLFIAVLGILGFLSLSSELAPVEDEDFITGYINTSNSAPEAVRDQWFASLDQVLQTIPERLHVSNYEYQKRWMGWNMLLKPRAERNRSAQEIVNELEEKFKSFVGPNVNAFVGEEGGGGLNGQDAFKVIIQYPGDYLTLTNIVKAIKQDIKKNPNFIRSHSEQLWEVPRLEVSIDKAMAQEQGVSMENIENTLYTLLTGKKATQYNFKGYDYDVLVRADKASRTEMSRINAFFVTGGQGQMIPLASLISLKEALSPGQIKHFDRVRGASINVTMKPNLSLDKAMGEIEPIVKKHLPKDANFRFGGSAEKYKEARTAMWFTYALALVFMYLMLAALFESFVHPLLVLLTVPLSIAGAVWAIHGINGTNNIYTAIGLVTLIGLITKHGILIVDFSNRLRALGFSIKEAVIEASLRRLRPILMTTFAMICGAVPLVFSLGAGAIARHHIGWIIIGGMFTGTFFSLFVVPVAYCLTAKKWKSVIEESEIEEIEAPDSQLKENLFTETVIVTDSKTNTINLVTKP